MEDLSFSFQSCDFQAPPCLLLLTEKGQLKWALVDSPYSAFLKTPMTAQAVGGSGLAVALTTPALPVL